MFNLDNSTAEKLINGFQIPVKPEVLAEVQEEQAKPSQAKPSQAKPSQAKPSQAKPSHTPLLMLLPRLLLKMLLCRRPF